MGWEDYWEMVNTGRQGPVGDDGTTADTGYWTSGTTYYENHRCTHSKSGFGQGVYRSKVFHVASAASEPEVGALWETYWEEWAGGGADGLGSGDVVGPASAVTDNIMTYYDVTGKRIKDSGVSINNVLFNNLTAFSGVIDRTGDYVLLYDVSAGVYRKCLIQKMHRANETISLMAKGLHPRNTVSPSKALTGVDLPTNRHYVKAIPFAKTAMSYADCSFIMPEFWDGGAITATFYGMLISAVGGGIRMGIGGLCVTHGETQDAAMTDASVTMHSVEAAYSLIESDPVSFTPSAYVSTSRVGGCKILLHVYRYTAHAEDSVASDFYLTDAYLSIGVKDV